MLDALSRLFFFFVAAGKWLRDRRWIGDRGFRPWFELARRHGLKAHRTGSGTRLVGRFHGIGFEVRTPVRWGPSHPIEIVAEGSRLPWRAGPPGRHPATFRTGDPEFDAAVALTGDPAAICTVLDASARLAVRRLVEAGGFVRDGLVILPVTGPVGDVEGARRLASLAYAAAHAVHLRVDDLAAHRLAVAAVDPAPFVRAGALEAAGREHRDDPRVADALSMSLHGPDPWLRTAAARVLARADVLEKVALAGDTPREVRLHALTGIDPREEAVLRRVAVGLLDPVLGLVRPILHAARELPVSVRLDVLRRVATGLPARDLDDRAVLDDFCALVASCADDGPAAAAEQALLAAVAFPHDAVCFPALDRLARIGTVAAVPALVDLEAASSRLSGRRRAIRRTIEAIQARLDPSVRGGLSLSAGAVTGGEISLASPDPRGRVSVPITDEPTDPGKSPSG